MDAESFVEIYSEALSQGDAALFVGAGLSRPAGLVDWRGLLRDLANELCLDIDQESDLIAVAQYHVNTTGGRIGLDQAIMTEFTKDTLPSPAHEIIARLPLKTIWTTNYDTLIEDAFKKIGKRLDVKRVSLNIAVTLPRRDCVLYKMHGDVSDPASAVLTKEDYETYALTRQPFATALEADLLTKTFLFLGFSFNDPNLDYVLARIRRLLGDHQRRHYCLMRPPPEPPTAAGAATAEWEYERRKFDLRVADLKRYSIQTITIDEYDEIPSVLADVDRAVRTSSVFVSGSAAEYGSFGQDRLQEFLRKLGSSLVERGLKIVSGLGIGVGGAVVLGAMERMYQADDVDLGATERLLAIRPFPIGVQDDRERRDMWSRHREHLLEEVGATIFVAGNRLENGELVNASGVEEEFTLGLKLNVTPIPVGATGYVAESLWRAVAAEPTKFFGDIDVEKELVALGSIDSTVDELVEAVLSILEKLD